MPALENSEISNLSAPSALKDHLALARPDHWFKNVFMLPGMALALLLARSASSSLVLLLFVGFVSTCLVASANYTINEWLDSKFDRHHPIKRHRPSPSGRIDARLVWFQYVILAAAGLGLSFMVSGSFLIFSIILLAMGVLYNARPFRTKDVPYLDVLSEALNNPLRFLLGWSVVIDGVLPPSSILLAYWMGGAYLMAIKRYAELRFIGDRETAGLYRLSFRRYTEDSLLVSAFFYALVAAFFIGIFLLKYRIEFILSIPFFALLFSWYLAIGMKPRSPAQNPEKLYREKWFIGYVVFLGAIVTALFFVDFPWLNTLIEFRVLAP